MAPRRMPRPPRAPGPVVREVGRVLPPARRINPAAPDLGSPRPEGTPMAYCHDCGAYAALDDADMCARCRDGWRPAGPVLADLGIRRQPLGDSMATPGKLTVGHDGRVTGPATISHN